MPSSCVTSLKNPLTSNVMSKSFGALGNVMLMFPSGTSVSQRYLDEQALVMSVRTTVPYLYMPVLNI